MDSLKGLKTQIELHYLFRLVKGMTLYSVAHLLRNLISSR